AILQRASNVSDHPDEETPADLVHDHLIQDRARDLEEEHGPDVAERYYRAATGGATFIRDVQAVYFAERTGQINESTRSQQRPAVAALLKWSGEYTTLEDIDDRKAGAYVTHLLSPAAGLKRSTARRHLSALSRFWRWLGSRGHVARNSNPWRGHDLGKATQSERDAFTDDELVALLAGKPDERQEYFGALRDLLRLCLVTGARQNELCGL